MVVYTVEAVTALFASIENMGGRPTFRKLWGFAQEMERALKRVQTRAQPVEGHAPRMRSPAEQALVCNIPWVPPENVGEFFVCPVTAITETDQRTAEREWKAKSDRHQNNENVELASILLFERVIPVIYHLGGTAMGIGGFGTQTAYQIKEALRSRFGTPTDAEMKEALVKMETPMIRDEPIEVVLRMMEEVQLFLLAHPEGGHEMTEVQLIRNVIMKMRDLGGLWTRPLEKWLIEPVLTRQTWTYFKTFMVTKYEEMLTARGGSTTLGDDGYAAYNAYGVEDTELTENVVRYAEQATATAAAVGDLTARIAAMEMAAAQPVGLGLPPAPPQAAYYAPQDHYEIPPPRQPHYPEYPHPGPFGSDQEWAHWSMQTSGEQSHQNGNKRARYGPGPTRPPYAETTRRTNDGWARSEYGGRGAGRASRGGGARDFSFDFYRGRGAGREAAGRGRGNTHTNTLKRYDQLLYCPNKGCGYDVDHAGRNCPYAAPWDVAREVAHTVEGASMRGQHKSLANGTGAGMGWIMRGPIAQAQWVVDQRRAYGQSQGEARGSGGRFGGRGGRGRNSGRGRY